MMVCMSAAENARSVSVRTLPKPAMLNESAVAAISSGASVMVTTSYRCAYRKLDPNILMMESAENGT